MKILIPLIFIISLAACGPDSSPEKRLNTKTDSIQQQLDSLKLQNAAILDSIKAIKDEIRAKK